MSLMGAQPVDFITALEIAGIELLWHPSISEQTGSELNDIINQIENGDRKLDILCLEGSVMCGPNGTGRFHIMAGSNGRPMKDVIETLSNAATHIVAVGSCAAFGGITAAGNTGAHDDLQACGLSFDGEKKGGLLGGDFKGKSGLPVVNIPGCPVHPDWVTETLMHISSGAMNTNDLDQFLRPTAITKTLVHHGCSRNEFYEFKASAETLGDMGCMMENLGCKGTQAAGDCNTRPWNGSGSCITGGYPCIACTEPDFEKVTHPFIETPKIAGIPIGLPTDMPKAWFVALASLSKAATPKRLRENAVSDRIQILPRKAKPKDQNKTSSISSSTFGPSS